MTVVNPGGTGAGNTDPWHIVGSGGSEPNFQNGWVISGGGDLRFRKDGNGIVNVRGTLTGGTAAAQIFQLPATYWPNTVVYVACPSSGGTVALTMTAAGVFSLGLGGATITFLNAVWDATP